jgi:hypothetical protein
MSLIQTLLRGDKPRMEISGDVMLALGAAPAVITSGVLMPVRAIALPTDAEVLAIAGGGITADMITREALRLIRKNLAFQRAINRQYEAFHEGTLTIRRPLAYGPV